MDLAASAGPYDDVDMRYPPSAAGTASASPIDPAGDASGGEADPASALGPTAGVGGTMNILGKPLATNNFVTKLYQMINDAKSAHYIAWTELGTSFVVSNVGEFSRSILGSHFKHNNVRPLCFCRPPLTSLQFSSFVRQLNMYGFHKINRTPRAQRTSTDAQTWEFSHHKFLRGRPDLLDEIKRKALEPDPALKHRVELPGEVAAQLNAMRDENRRVWEQLSMERKRTEHLTGALQRLWEFVGTRVGGCTSFSVSSFECSLTCGAVGNFPPDLLDTESPNIFVTSPGQGSSSGGSGNSVGGSGGSGGGGKFAPPPLSMNNVHMGTLHTMHSPGSGSPTQSEFNTHQHQQQQQQSGGGGNGGGSGNGPPSAGPPSLSRQHSFQHISYLRGDASSMPGSPGSTSMDLYDDSSDTHIQTRISTKRPRISTDDDMHHPHQHQHQHQHQHPHSTHPHTHPHPHATHATHSPHPLHHPYHGSAPSSAHPDHHATNAHVGTLSSLSPISTLAASSLSPPSSLGAPTRKPSRARSDSAPLGYGFGLGVGQGGMWGGGGRPRSGSGLAGRGVPNIGNVTRTVTGGGVVGGGGGAGGGVVGVGGGGGGMVPSIPSVSPNAPR
ncbi:hypothetical protein H0H87_010321 [Tephrocybe sp. NHM501043]|nr:hypothetical protein H0H87_010321 [Tephrocybe sp. NHM501043]